MKKRLLFACVIGALFFSSCKKNKDATDSGSRAKVLKKMTQTLAGEETIYDFNYDAGKRLVSIKSTDNTKVQSFTYNASGKLTGLIDEDASYRQVHSFIYANDIPISGNYKVFEKQLTRPDHLLGERQMVYTVVNNQVENIHVDHLLFAAQKETNFSLSYTGGNLTKVQVTKGAFYEGVYTYGNRRSVFPKIFDFIMDVSSEHAFLFGVKNEILIARHDFDGTELNRIITTQYTYDTDGYVLTSDDGTIMRTFDYE